MQQPDGGARTGLACPPSRSMRRHPDTGDGGPPAPKERDPRPATHAAFAIRCTRGESDAAGDRGSGARRRDGQLLVFFAAAFVGAWLCWIPTVVVRGAQRVRRRPPDGGCLRAVRGCRRARGGDPRSARGSRSDSRRTVVGDRAARAAAAERLTETAQVTTGGPFACAWRAVHPGDAGRGLLHFRHGRRTGNRVVAGGNRDRRDRGGAVGSGAPRGAASAEVGVGCDHRCRVVPVRRDRLLRRRPGSRRGGDAGATGHRRRRPQWPVPTCTRRRAQRSTRRAVGNRTTGDRHDGARQVLRADRRAARHRPGRAARCDLRADRTQRCG